MVLMNVKMNKCAVIFFVVLMAFSSLKGGAQKLKKERFDAGAKSWHLETFPVNLKASPEAKTNISIVAADTSLTLFLSGTGTGTSTVDLGSELVFLLDNDSTVVARSTAIQGINFENLVSSYHHQYEISMAGLKALSQHQVRALRKFSAGGVDVIPIVKKNAGKVKELSTFFTAKLKEKNLFTDKPLIVPAGFPGGNQSLTRFLNRNFSRLPELQNGEKKSTFVTIHLTAGGTVSDIQLGTSLGATMDNELLRIFNRMPKWKSALQNGKPISFKVVLPITVRNLGDSIQVELF